MSNAKESQFQRYIIDTLQNNLNCLVLKNDPSYIQGFPDLSIFCGGKAAFLECKLNNNSPHQPNQDYYINKLNKMGFFAEFISRDNSNQIIANIIDYFCL